MVAIGTMQNCRGKEAPIAELAEILGGEATKKISGSKWQRAAPGDEFRSEDGVRTSRDGSARVKFSDEAILRLGPSTTLIFGAKLRLRGEIQNESAGSMTLKLAGKENKVKLEPGAKISITGNGAEGRILVLVGSAVVTTEEGEFDLGVGDMQVIVGQIEVEEIDDKPVDAGIAADAAIDAALIETVSATVKGKGVRIKDNPEAKERRLASGAHELPSGAAVSVRRGSAVSFSRGAELVELKGKGRATVGTPGAPLVSIGRGRASLLGKEQATTVSVPGGTVVARAAKGRGSVIAVTVGSNSKIVPKSGRADVSSSKARETVQIGERIEMSRSGEMAVFGRQPTIADFSIRAGESASIHDPGAPTAVRIRFSDKCSDGLIEWKGSSKQRVRGDGSGITALRPGTHRYAIRCFVDGDLQVASVVSGRIRVDRSSGTKPLPAKPPHNIIDATGEKYDIFYQNLLPHVTIRWPNAKKGRRYKLHVKRSSAAAKVYSTSGPSHRVKKLSEGSYRFWFEGDGARSKEGLMTIKFDNAASSGYLRRPRVGGSWGGGHVMVEGAGIPGTRVSVAGVSLDVDGQHRFKVAVEKPGSEAAISVRFSTSGRGVHYYVRRNGRR